MKSLALALCLSSLSAFGQNLPKLQLQVFGQVVSPGCRAGSTCRVGSLISAGAVSGTTGTFTGAVSGASFATTGNGSVTATGSGTLSGGSVASNTMGSLVNATLTLSGWVADGATAIAVKTKARTSLTTAGAQIEAWYSDDGTTKKAAIDKDGSYLFVGNPTLQTCAAGLEGTVSRDVLSGVATGKRTKLCLCTSDGSSVYVWQNLATGTLGTTTACGSE